MSVPLYFLDRVNSSQAFAGGAVSRSLLAERGIAEVFADCEPGDIARVEVIGQGPSGNPGVILSALPVRDRQPPRRLGFYPAEQRWEDCGGLWIGLDTVAPPTPAELSRKQQYRGHIVRLADGQDWEVPALRMPISGGTSLPREMYWDVDGSFKLRIKRQYEQVWERSARSADLFYSPQSPGFGDIDLEEALGLAIEALSLNYRVGRNEQRVLGLVDTTNWSQVLGATVDLPNVQAALRAQEEAQKKS